MTTWEVTGPEAVEPDTYLARCVEIEEIDSQYGRRIRWKFQLPDADGHEVSRFTSTSFSEKSRAMETVNALFGRKLERHERFEKEQLIGRSCRLVLDVAESGYNSVTNALPLPRKPAAKPVPAPQPDDYGDDDQ